MTSCAWTGTSCSTGCWRGNRCSTTRSADRPAAPWARLRTVVDDRTDVPGATAGRGSEARRAPGRPSARCPTRDPFRGFPVRAAVPWPSGLCTVRLDGPAAMWRDSTRTPKLPSRTSDSSSPTSVTYFQTVYLCSHAGSPNGCVPRSRRTYRVTRRYARFSRPARSGPRPASRCSARCRSQGRGAAAHPAAPPTSTNSTTLSPRGTALLPQRQPCQVAMTCGLPRICLTPPEMNRLPLGHGRAQAAHPHRTRRTRTPPTLRPRTPAGTRTVAAMWLLRRWAGRVTTSAVRGQVRSGPRCGRAHSGGRPGRSCRGGRVEGRGYQILTTL